MAIFHGTPLSDIQCIPHVSRQGCRDSESKVKSSGVDNEDGSGSYVLGREDVGSPDDDLDSLDKTADSGTMQNKVCYR